MLGKLPVQVGADRVLLFSGKGMLGELLAQAEEVIGEQYLGCKSRWERVLGEGGISYYATTCLVGGVDIVEVGVDTPTVCDSFHVSVQLF